MQQLTVRGFDTELERRLRELAQREGISLNRAALRLMRLGAGLEQNGDEGLGAVGHSLDEFFGTMSEEEAQQILEAVEIFEQIDEEMWR